uniref:Uncharacterized protein n=1 Tax=Tetradesmus obliquus TaxID=3088 RepID=A0A383VK86_TETOB|eukprot:jgi/Sobl393_1/13329/SZX64776.1
MSAAAADVPIEGKTVKMLTLLSAKRTYDLFAQDSAAQPGLDPESQKIKLACKIKDEYAAAQHFDAAALAQRATSAAQQQPSPAGPVGPKPESRTPLAKLIDTIPVQARQQNGAAAGAAAAGAGALIPFAGPAGAGPAAAAAAAPGGVAAPQQQKAIMAVINEKGSSSAAVSRRLASKWPRPAWHAPWKCYRVISGHLGWVRCIAFDSSNEWFATGSADRTIKLWDAGSGQLKLTLTGHIEQVTGLAVSARHPYMFSASLDKEVKCWDLEQNKVIRNYHGHLSGVYCLALHPTLDLIMTGGRDSTCRVWDMRTKTQVFALAGHTNTVSSVLTQPTDPQVLTGSHDSTIRLWDLRKGSTLATLTYHKKSVRALTAHPSEHTFASGGADNIKKFKLPNGDFLHNMLAQQRSIINAMAVNEDGVLASGGDNGSLWMWDWRSGHCFQQQDSIVQPGSLDSEAGIYALAYDMSGSRLVSCEADKTVKMWREDEAATPQSHPVNFKPPKDIRRF